MADSKSGEILDSELLDVRPQASIDDAMDCWVGHSVFPRQCRHRRLLPSWRAPATVLQPDGTNICFAEFMAPLDTAREPFLRHHVGDIVALRAFPKMRWIDADGPIASVHRYATVPQRPSNVALKYQPRNSDYSAVHSDVWVATSRKSAGPVTATIGAIYRAFLDVIKHVFMFSATHHAVLSHV